MTYHPYVAIQDALFFSTLFVSPPPRGYITIQLLITNPSCFAIQDAQRAIGLVRASATKWGLNASRVGFTGSSAGGHLTAHISTAYKTRVYARVDAADDISCRPDFSIFMYVAQPPPVNTDVVIHIALSCKSRVIQGS